MLGRRLDRRCSAGSQTAGSLPGPPRLAGPPANADPPARAAPQGHLCTLWSCACLALVCWLHASLNGEAQHLFVMFFQPFVPPLLMLWLWIANVRHWELSRIDFESCFSSKDRKLLPSSRDVFKVRAGAQPGGLGWPLGARWSVWAAWQPVAG
jgi:hypothetical protein